METDVILTPRCGIRTEPHLGTGKQVCEFHFNLRCHLVVFNKDAPRAERDSNCSPCQILTKERCKGTIFPSLQLCPNEGTEEFYFQRIFCWLLNFVLLATPKVNSYEIVWDSVRVNLYCQDDWIWNHLGDTPISMPLNTLVCRVY